MSFSAEPLPEPYREITDKVFKKKDALLQYSPGKCIFSPALKNIEQDILDCQVREDDVWFISYPRTGSTWSIEMVWLVQNNLDFERAREEMLQVRVPLIETSAVFAEDWAIPFMQKYGHSVEVVNNGTSPRIIRSHLPFELLPKQLDKVKPKIIYIARNPKDISVSFYHYLKNFHNLETNFEEFCDLFLAGVMPPGSYFDHVMTFWKKRHEPHVLFLTYEEMKKDLRTAIEKVAMFLEKKIPEEKMELLLDHLSFENMKKNSACNLEAVLKLRTGKVESDPFMRKGEIGDWKNYLSPDMSEKFDDFIATNTKGTGLTFRY